MKLDTTATNSNSTQRIVSFQTSCCWRFTPAALSHHQHSLKDVLLANDLDNFHNFPPASHALHHVVLSLMSRLVHILSSSMLSFVSTSSKTVFVFSTRAPPAPLDQLPIRSIPRPFVSRLAIDQQSTCFRICVVDQSSTHFQNCRVSVV